MKYLKKISFTERKKELQGKKEIKKKEQRMYNKKNKKESNREREKRVKKFEND